MKESIKNRNLAYKELIPHLGARQLAVCNLLESYGALTGNEISRKMVLPLSSVMPRLHELEHRGMVIESGWKVDDKTKKRNTKWELTTDELGAEIREAKRKFLTEKAVHLAVDLGNVASVTAINLIRKEIKRTDRKLYKLYF